jgi:hypothetical protein
VEANELIDLARKHDISERTLRDAKKELGIETDKTVFQGDSKWKLPDA